MIANLNAKTALKEKDTKQIENKKMKENERK